MLESIIVESLKDMKCPKCGNKVTPIPIGRYYSEYSGFVYFYYAKCDRCNSWISITERSVKHTKRGVKMKYIVTVKSPKSFAEYVVNSILTVAFWSDEPFNPALLYISKPYVKEFGEEVAKYMYEELRREYINEGINDYIEGTQQFPVCRSFKVFVGFFLL